MFKKAIFLGIVFLIVAGCRTTGDSELKNEDGTDRLAGKTFCRTVGSLGGPPVKTCLDFDNYGRGTERDTSGGIPRADEFAYSVSGSRVTIIITGTTSGSRLRDMNLSADATSLTYREGGYNYIWTVEGQTGESLAGKKYCRMVGSLGGPRVKTCMEFKENGTGIERDTSGGIPRNDAFTYHISGSKVTISFTDGVTKKMTLGEGGRTLTYQEGSRSFEWQVESSTGVAGKTFCRTVGSLGGPPVKTCLEFFAEGTGIEKDTSGGIPRNDHFTYIIGGHEVTVTTSDDPRTARTRTMMLSSDGKNLTYQEGDYSFVWSLEP